MPIGKNICSLYRKLITGNRKGKPIWWTVSTRIGESVKNNSIGSNFPFSQETFCQTRILVRIYCVKCTKLSSRLIANICAFPAVTSYNVFYKSVLCLKSHTSVHYSHLIFWVQVEHMEKCSALWVKNRTKDTCLSQQSPLSFAAEGKGPLFKPEMAARDIVTTMNIAVLHKC